MTRCFLIDASAIVPFFFNLKPAHPDTKAKSAIARLLKFRTDGTVDLFIPNICIAECSKAFANIAFGRTDDPEKAKEYYESTVNALLDVVSNSRKGLIRSIPFERKHLVGIEDVFVREHSRKDDRRDGDLSGHDAIVIAMGRELERSRGKGQVFIVTKDKGMAAVCNQNPSFFPKAIHVLSDPIPDGG